MKSLLFLFQVATQIILWLKILTNSGLNLMDPVVLDHTVSEVCMLHLHKRTILKLTFYGPAAKHPFAD